MNDKIKKHTKGKFRVAACAIIVNQTGQILLTKRDHDPDAWELVSGRFNQNFSTLEDEILREIKEELGSDFKCRLIAPISFYHFYRSNDKNEELVGINYLCEYIKGKVKISEEHTCYQWLSPEKAYDLVSHELLKKDIKHFMKLKDLYLANKDTFINNFKKSNQPHQTNF